MSEQVGYNLVCQWHHTGTSQMLTSVYHDHARVLGVCGAGKEGQAGASAECQHAAHLRGLPVLIMGPTRLPNRGCQPAFLNSCSSSWSRAPLPSLAAVYSSICSSDGSCAAAGWCLIHSSSLLWSWHMVLTTVSGCANVMIQAQVPAVQRPAC